MVFKIRRTSVELSSLGRLHLLQRPSLLVGHRAFRPRSFTKDWLLSVGLEQRCDLFELMCAGTILNSFIFDYLLLHVRGIERHWSVVVLVRKMIFVVLTFVEAHSKDRRIFPDHFSDRIVLGGLIWFTSAWLTADQTKFVSLSLGLKSLSILLGHEVVALLLLRRH